MRLKDTGWTFSPTDLATFVRGEHAIHLRKVGVPVGMRKPVRYQLDGRTSQVFFIRKRVPGPGADKIKSQSFDELAADFLCRLWHLPIFADGRSTAHRRMLPVRAFSGSMLSWRYDGSSQQGAE